MNYLVIALVIFGVIAIIAIALKFFGFNEGQGQITITHDAKSGLFTPTEMKFLVVLDQVVGTHYRIMAQVRLAHIIKSEKGTR